MPAGGKRPGAGRPVGSLNVERKNVRDLAREHTEGCIAELWRLAKGARGEMVRTMAIQQLMDRGWGRAPAHLKITGDFDNPLTIINASMTPEQAAEAYANVLRSPSEDIEEG